MRVCLFDMDGTLTPARGRMKNNMVKVLSRLQRKEINIGIVSGSDIDYIEEQCSLLFEDFSFDHHKVLWYPCNGTKHYTYDMSGKRKICYENNMKTEIGDYLYGDTIRILLESQISIKYNFGIQNLPLSGTFIKYRGSMINWCPIGRDASPEERQKWIDIDKKFNIRERMLDRLNSFASFQKLETRLGGETSFDIFPKGWDKTYVLQNFSKQDEIYFIGDKCEKNGNDKEIYDIIKTRGVNRSFKTTGPDATIAIIESKILQE